MCFVQVLSVCVTLNAEDTSITVFVTSDIVTSEIPSFTL